MGRLDAQAQASHFAEVGELVEQWYRWRDSAQDAEDRQPSARLCEILLLIAEHLCRKARFRTVWKAEPELRDECKSEALLKCLKNLKNVKEEKVQAIWKYMTLACYHAILTTITRSYRRRERDDRIRQAIMRKYASDMPWLFSGKPDLGWLRDDGDDAYGEDGVFTN